MAPETGRVARGAGEASLRAVRHPTGQFYQWERKAERADLEGLPSQKRGRKRVNPREEQLLAEIEQLREVIAELNRENLALKMGI